MYQKNHGDFQSKIPVSRSLYCAPHLVFLPWRKGSSHSSCCSPFSPFPLPCTSWFPHLSCWKANQQQWSLPEQAEQAMWGPELKELGIACGHSENITVLSTTVRILSPGCRTNAWLLWSNLCRGKRTQEHWSLLCVQGASLPGSPGAGRVCAAMHTQGRQDLPILGP